MGERVPMNQRDTFLEVQTFRKTWVLALVLPISLFLVILFGYGMIKQLILGQPWGNRPLPDVALAIIGPLGILFGLGLALLFYSAKLITEVREDGVYVRFFPLTHQKIPFEDIRHVEARTYSPIKEFGGWGIRYVKGGKAYVYEGGPLASWALQIGGFTSLFLVDMVAASALLLTAITVRFLYSRFGFKGYGRTAFVVVLVPYAVVTMAVIFNNVALTFV